MLIYYVGGVDYTPGPYSVNFYPNQTHALLNIEIFNNSVLEDNKMFNLTINSFSLPFNINASNPDWATVIIEDDDGNCVILNYNYVVKTIIELCMSNTQLSLQSYFVFIYKGKN